MLVDDAAEYIVADDPSARFRGHRSGDRWGELEAAMGPRLVVMAEVLVEHRFEMSTRDDEEVVEAVLSDGPHEPFGEGVRLRRGDRGSYGLDADGGEHSVEAGGELGIRSRMRNRKLRPAPSRSDAKLRAAWVTQGPLGLAVTPSRCTRRRSISMTKST